MPSGFIPASIASGDFNGDSKTDWAVANAGDNNLWVYLGNGDGTASIPRILGLQGAGPTSVATADLRGNGKIDIIVTEADSSSVEVLLGNGDGTFHSTGVYLVPAPPTAVAVADFNKDGHPDVVVAMLGTSPIGFLPGRGDGTLGAPVVTAWGGGGAQPISLSVADINRDGNLDLAYIDLGGGAGISLGRGDGTFNAGTIIAGNIGAVGLEYLAVALGDMNEDGCPDLVATEDFSFTEIYIGNCDGTFAASTFHGTGDIGVSIALKDIDGDGHLDVIVGGDFSESLLGEGEPAGNLLSVAKGDGRGNLASATVFRGRTGMYSMIFLDLNGATLPSVITANQDTDSLTLYTNDGTGDFGTPRGEAIGYSGGTANSPYSNMLAADVNGDHHPDLLAINVPQYSPGSFQLATMLNLGDGHFGPPAFTPMFPDSFDVPGDFAAADFRNTGHPDVIAVGVLGDTTRANPFLAFAKNNGDGTFAGATVGTPSTAEGVIGVGDFNRDGKLDFVTLDAFPSGSDGQTLNVFLGKGDGTFSPQPAMPYGGTAGRWPVSVYVGDFNNDGKLDVMVYLYYNTVPFTANDVYVFYGNGDGTFRSPLKIFSNSDPFTFVDVNHDGIPDIVSCRFQEADYPAQTPESISIMLGVAGGGFRPPTIYDPYSGYSILPAVSGTTLGGQGYCTVGDFNGDGNPDIGVMQTESYSFAGYVQFLSGNGDGTFTPTYNVYSFDRQVLPQNFYDLDGDGKTDLLELDAYNSSFNFIPGTAAATFQLETVTEPITGDTGSAQVSLNVPSGSDTVITLAASDPGLQVPSSVTVPAGSVSQEFTYTVTDQADVHHVFKISATLGAEQETAYNFVQTDHRVLTGFGFSMYYSTSQVYAGYASSDYQPGYETQPNYSTALQFSCSGLPPGVTCDFRPTSAQLAPNQYTFSSMFVDATIDAAPGTYQFEAVASDSNSQVSFPASITVYPPSPDLHVAAQADESGITNTPMQVQFTVTNNGNAPAHSTIATASFNQFGVNQNLTGLSSSVGTCSLSSQTCNLGTVNVGDVITITSNFVPLGVNDMSALLSVSESEQDIHRADNNNGTAITADDYTLSLSTSSLTVNRGSNGTVTVTLQPIVGGAFNLPIALGCSGLPNGGSCTFTPSAPTPGMSGATAVLTLSVPQTAAKLQAHPNRGFRALLAQLLIPVGAFLLIPKRRKARKRLVIGGTMLIVLLILQACGGGGSGSTTPPGGGGTTTPPPTNYSITVTGNGGGDQHAATLTLTVD